MKWNEINQIEDNFVIYKIDSIAQFYVHSARVD